MFSSSTDVYHLGNAYVLFLPLFNDAFSNAQVIYVVISNK